MGGGGARAGFSVWSATQERVPLDVLEETGYLLQFSNILPEPPDGEEARKGSHDARESIGVRIDEEGPVRDVVLGSPADAAGLATGLKVAGVDGHVRSMKRFADAIEPSVTTAAIARFVISGDTYVTRTVDDDDGPRHLVLVGDEARDDRLAEILTSR